MQDIVHLCQPFLYLQILCQNHNHALIACHLHVAIAIQPGLRPAWSYGMIQN